MTLSSLPLPLPFPLDYFPPLLLWHLLAPYLSAVLVQIYFRLSRARRSSPIYRCSAYKKTLLALTLLALLSSLAHTYISIRSQATLYTALHNLPITASPKALKRRWREISLLHHPDVAATTTTTTEDTEKAFVGLAQAYRVLADPVSRFAYDRLGEAVIGSAGSGRGYLHVEMPATLRAAVWRGVFELVPCYAVMVLCACVGGGQWSRYWRIYITLSSLALEIFILTRPYNPLPVDPENKTAIPPLLQFQQLALLRHLVFVAVQALRQIDSVMQPPSKSKALSEKELERLCKLANGVESGMGMALVIEGMPFKEGEGAELRGLVEERVGELWMETVRLRDEEVMKAMAEVRERKERGREGEKGTM